MLLITFRFHPFYISDSSEGGFGQKRESEQRQQRVFAGVAYDNEGYPYPTACEYVNRIQELLQYIAVNIILNW